MTKTERLLPNGIPKYIRIYDNQDKSFDRFTCVFTRIKGYYYLAASSQPFHPLGFGTVGNAQYQPIDKPSYKHLGKKIKFESLPEDVKTFIIQTYKTLWEL